MFELKSSQREISFEKMLLEFDKFFNVIVKYLCFQKQPLEVFYKKAVLKKLAIFTGKHLHWSIFLIKLQALQLYCKEIPTQLFSCEYCEIFKKTYFEEYCKRQPLHFSVNLIAKSLLLCKKWTSSPVILHEGFKIYVDSLWNFWNS